MKIITWNCQGAFRKKAEFILPLQPDILILQECEHPDKLKFADKRPHAAFWHGDSVHKGIGIFSFSEYKFELLPCFSPTFRHIIPLHVTGNGLPFILFAIWAMDNKEDHKARYIGQIWNAIKYYTELLGGSTILTGDFNSNKIWDYKDRVGTHSDVVAFLGEKGIHSVYHKHFGMEQGKEQHPTFFLQKKEYKPYHLDYCFASTDLLETMKGVEIGKYETWTTHSDHMPLTIEFEV